MFFLNYIMKLVGTLIHAQQKSYHNDWHWRFLVYIIIYQPINYINFNQRPSFTISHLSTEFSNTYKFGNFDKTKFLICNHISAIFVLSPDIEY